MFNLDPVKVPRFLRDNVRLVTYKRFRLFQVEPMFIS